MMSQVKIGGEIAVWPRETTNCQGDRCSSILHPECIRVQTAQAIRFLAAGMQSWTHNMYISKIFRNDIHLLLYFSTEAMHTTWRISHLSDSYDMVKLDSPWIPLL